jgi:hypothetical protein
MDLLGMAGDDQEEVGMLKKLGRNRRYVLHALARIPVLFVFLILGSLITPSYIDAQTTFKLDQASVILNGTPIFIDNFNDGIEPPSAPNFLTGQSASYFVNGTFPDGSESGGKLDLNIVNGADSVTPNGRPSRIHSIRLLTSTNPLNARNLGPDDTFVVSGLFDLKDSAGNLIVANTPPSGGFRAGVSDRTTPQGPGDTSNDVSRVQVEVLDRDRPPPNAQNPNRFGCRDPLTGLDVGAKLGEVVVEFTSSDFVLNRSTRIDCFKIDLRGDPDQIRLTAAKNDPASNVLTGSFTYLKEGTEISTTVFPNTDTIFNGGVFPPGDPLEGTVIPPEQHTRAQFDTQIVPGAALRKFVTMTSPVTLSQIVDTPGAAFNLEFDFLFETIVGQLTVLLDGIVLGSISAPTVPGTDFTTRSILVNNPSLLGRTDINLEFRLDVPSGSTVLLDNIIFPGVINGDFQTGSLTGWDTTGTGSVGVTTVQLTPELVNDKVSLVNMTTAFSATPCGGASAGTFTIRATFENISSDDLLELFFNPSTLTNGNVLCNADGGSGGVGSRLSVPLAGDFNDGKLAPGESFDVVFQIGLASRSRFTFLVDLFGVVEPVD